MTTTQFISLGKGKARARKGKIAGHSEYIYYFDTVGNIAEVKLCYDTADRLLIELRDEAHRFANHQRKRRMKNDFK